MQSRFRFFASSRFRVNFPVTFDEGDKVTDKARDKVEDSPERARYIGWGHGDCAPCPSHTTGHAVFRIRRLDTARVTFVPSRSSTEWSTSYWRVPSLSVRTASHVFTRLATHPGRRSTRPAHRGAPSLAFSKRRVPSMSSPDSTPVLPYPCLHWASSGLLVAGSRTGAARDGTDAGIHRHRPPRRRGG